MRLLPAAVALFLVVVPTASAAGIAAGHAKHVCGQVTGRVAACTAEVRTNADMQPLATSTYQSGFAPSSLQSAYNLGGAVVNGGSGQVVGIVDAYDAPNLEGDLGVYRSQFGLAPCTSAGGASACFRKVNQTGGATLPTANASWAQETSLDVEMVSAICPNCRILVVEASSASYADLATAVDTAAALGATQISNSYGGSELYGGAYESHYNHPGVDITVSSGDSGYGVEFPASSPHVTAVGGTHLVKDSSARGWTETVWSGAGSGCSGTFAKPSYQKDTGCSRRTVADQAAVADPNTGVAVYDSYPYQGASGWFVFGGTSVASPIIASVDALAGGRSPDTTYGGFPYANPTFFNDVLSGSNGSCSGSYLCTGKAGYDGPTGMGTPNGAGQPAPPQAPSAGTPGPSISGNAVEGSTLTANNGSWNGNPTSYSYDWESCNPGCLSVGTASTYKLQHSDVNATITVTVTALNSLGQASATSDPVGPVAALAPDFTISMSPSSRSIKRGSTTTFTVTVTPNATYTGNVSLSASGGPSGSTLSLSPAATATTSTLTVRTAGSATGTYTITVSGTGNGKSHSASATLSVHR